MQLHKKLFVIFPGRFHPFHKGHKGVYDFLSSKFSGAEVYITSTNLTDPEKSPFDFEEKKKMAILAGVPASHILQVKTNYNIQSLQPLIPIDINRDSIIFAVSQKDMTEDPRFSSFVKKDGSPAYLQQLPKNIDKLQPAIKHGYIATVPTTQFSVLNMPANSASELRTRYANLTPDQRKNFVKDLYGKYDDDIYNIMNNKLNNISEKQKKSLKNLIVGILKEDDDFMSALVGPESKFKSAIDKIHKRAGVLTKAAQDASKMVRPK